MKHSCFQDLLLNAATFSLINICRNRKESKKIPVTLEYFTQDLCSFPGSAYALCDMPYTKRVVINKATKKVRIRPSGNNIGIDAVQLISEENSQHCKGCPRIEYIVSREPPFQSGEPMRVKTTRFEDK